MRNKNINIKIITLTLIMLMNFSFASLDISYADNITNPQAAHYDGYRVNKLTSYKYFSNGAYINLIHKSDVLDNPSVVIGLRPRKEHDDIEKLRIDGSEIVGINWSGNRMSTFDKGGSLDIGSENDYRKTYKHNFIYEYNGKKEKAPIWMVALTNNGGILESDSEELLQTYEKEMKKLLHLREKVKKKKELLDIGDYHPTQEKYLNSAISEIEVIVFANSMKNKFSPYVTKDILEEIFKLPDEIIKYVESNKIKSPDILELNIGEYSGDIDNINKGVDLYLPKDYKIRKEDIEIITPRWVMQEHKSGNFKLGEKVIYSLKPIDAPYYGVRGTEYEKSEQINYNDLAQDWAINLIEDKGQKQLKISSINYESDYGEIIDGNIDGENIDLTIPFKANLDEIELNIFHNGSKAYSIDNEGNEKEILANTMVNVKQTKQIKISNGLLEKTYNFNIKEQLSTDNEIKEFVVKINGRDVLGEIDNINNEVIFKVNYSEVISNVQTEITINPMATINPGIYEIKDFTNPIEYIVTSESGKERKYKAYVERQEASSENKILSFEVGTIKGKIEDDVVKVLVPNNVDLKTIKPKIEISKYATINPKSLEEIDFSNNLVDYTVKAQNGDKKTYKVSIDKEDIENIGPSEEYLNKLKELRDNIYKKYKKETTFEDWEWMNIGFYEGIGNGYEKGIRETLDDLPERFDLYEHIGKLSHKKKTDLDRALMMLTSMGIDATDLTKFQIDGKPFITNAGQIGGKEITNLPEFLYTGNLGSVNDTIFALIGLDMGNYSIPADASMNRDNMVDSLVKYKYGSDGFGIDMVAMLMQSLYPYRGREDVGNKIDEGLSLLLGEKEANRVNPINKNFLGESWGSENSESTSQVIIALCSMGIDPFSDYRFSRGTDDNMIVNWINRFATSELDGFGHTDNSYNFMGTYQGMYALQWYINFIENGGKGNLYSLYYDGVPFNFGKEFSKEVEIVKFELLGKEGIIDHKDNTIIIELPEDILDEELKAQIPIIHIPKGATISPKIGEKQNFTKDVEYIVTAEDGITVKQYTVKTQIKEGIKGSKKNIEGAEIEGIEGFVIKYIDHQKERIDIELPGKTDESKLGSLKIRFKHQGISISPDEKGPQDFTKGRVTYTVTAEDGSTKEYKVGVSIKEGDKFWFTKFVLRGVGGNIDKENRKISLKLPYGTDVKSIVMNEAKFEPSDSTTSISPGLKQEQSYEERIDKDGNKILPVVSIVPYPAPIEGNIKYEVEIDYVSPSGRGKIEEFKVAGIDGKIEGMNIILELLEGTDKYDIEEFTPEIKWEGKTMDPDPKKKNNSLNSFYNDYVITDEDGNMNLYNIKIIESGSSKPEPSKPEPDDKIEKQDEFEIESFKIKGIEGEIDNSSGKIYIELPYELDLRNILPTIKTSKGSSIYPSSGQPLNLRRSATFTLTDGKNMREYSLIIRISEPVPATKLWDYLDRYGDIKDYQLVD